MLQHIEGKWTKLDHFTFISRRYWSVCVVRYKNKHTNYMCILKMVDYDVLKKLLTILGSIVDIVEWGGLGIIQEIENLRFVNKEDNHICFENYEEISTTSI